MSAGFKLRYRDEGGLYQEWLAHIDNLDVAKAAVEKFVEHGYKFAFEQALDHEQIAGQIPEGELKFLRVGKY
ncbi:hypothetical protein [Chelatococcus reniformis]|uniref:Uncharacterized protein n=1 Tax=Chelatococcus reniformis TaxID=1494448 RepID=A0A916XKZ6_9HYPH|nr:hypothetical protein [Chelatococcus reniformis]GGC78662.1 hypothetical protein GCM10010994_41060 [Chelatococcus reniformis]